MVYNVRVIEWDDGSNCCLLDSGQGSIFSKEMKPVRFLSRWGFRAPQHLFYPDFAVSRILFSVEDVIRHEATTLGLWKEAGIPCPIVLSVSGNRIETTGFPEAVSYWNLLNNSDSVESYKQLVTVYSTIRETAKRYDDPRYLHPDPSLSNFLYLPEEKTALAIDPGRLLRRDLDLASLDILLLVEHLTSLSALNTSQDVIAGYVQELRSSLTKVEAERIKALDHSNPLVARLYFSLREELGYRFRKRKKKNPPLSLQKYLESYQNFIKDLL
ncbi:MAG TPA: hypothetical protein VJI15_02235 [Candidatus Nanoarchaeia archaeon]|nr:hypothetical protein [Candidatus Nanoarchaeia archaeon]